MLQYMRLRWHMLRGHEQVAASWANTRFNVTCSCRKRFQWKVMK